MENKQRDDILQEMNAINAKYYFKADKLDRKGT